MQTLQNTFKLIVATLIFFTRLPLYRLCNVPYEYYRCVVPLWPLAGWVTGGVMAISLLILVPLLPLPVCVIIALLLRLLLTGALHEDGLADFCDAFGGSATTRQRILDIMKDSHIGTYGTLALIFYYLLHYNVLVSLIPHVADLTNIPLHHASAITIAVIDPIAKTIAATVIWFLSYARNEQTAKNRLTYLKPTIKQKAITIILGTLPAVILCPTTLMPPLLVAIITAITFHAVILHHINKKIQGYTGDCCGALFIISETTIHLTLLITIAILSNIPK